MDDYTLNFFKLKHLNIDLSKSEFIYNNDESCTLIIHLLRNTFKCPHCNSEDIKVRSMTVNNINYTIFVDIKSTIQLHRRKYHCNTCGKYFTEKNPIISENKNIAFMTDLKIFSI